MINKYAIAVLKKLKKQNLSETQILAVINDYGECCKVIDYLKDNKMILKYTHSDELVTDEVWFTISPVGGDILLEHKHQFVDKWFTRTMAIAALVISMFALLKQ